MPECIWWWYRILPSMKDISTTSHYPDGSILWRESRTRCLWTRTPWLLSRPLIVFSPLWENRVVISLVIQFSIAYRSVVADKYVISVQFSFNCSTASKHICNILYTESMLYKKAQLILTNTNFRMSTTPCMCIPFPFYCHCWYQVSEYGCNFITYDIPKEYRKLKYLFSELS